MPVSVPNCYVAVRDLGPGGSPVVPGSWNVTAHDDGWFELRRADDLRIFAWRANSVDARGLFAVFGPPALLAAIADSEPACMPLREAWQRRTEPAVRAWLRRWPIWRVDGQERNERDGSTITLTGAVRRLVPEGAQIPDPIVTVFPWLLRADGSITLLQAEAAIRVTSIARPALGRTLAGFALHTTAEDEPPR